MFNDLLKLIYQPCLMPVRFRGFKAYGAVKYPGGIRHYPRFPDQKEPEYTPTKLFRIERITGSKGFPYWQKKILRELGIDTYLNQVTIVKNIPEVNARLWQIKHLIRVTPITFPHGEPTKEDINNTILKENGECIVTKKLPLSDDMVEARDKFYNNPNKLSVEKIKRNCRLKWVNPWNGGYY